MPKHRRKVTWIESGLLQYMIEYVQKHYKDLEIMRSYQERDGAFVICQMVISNETYTIRLKLPSNAPYDARPLFESIRYKGQDVWKYTDDYKPHIPWGDQRRIHLYVLAGVYVQVHVATGTPNDIVEKVSFATAREISVEVSAMMRAHVSQLWGMTTVITRTERKALAKMQVKLP